MTDSKDLPSEKPMIRLEYDPEDAPPAYDAVASTSSNNFNPVRRPDSAPGSQGPSPSGPPPRAYEPTLDSKPYNPRENACLQGPPADALVAFPVPSYTYGHSPYESNAAAGPSRRPPAPASPSLGLGGLARCRSSSTGGSKVMGLVGMLVGADGVREVLNPPPPSFSRAPQRQFAYSPFPPLVAVSLDRALDRGFPLLPPQSHLQPHPFMAHDVNEQDWTTFLGHIHQVGTISPVNKSAANTSGTGPGLIGMLVTKGIEAALKTDKSSSVAQIVEHWNAYFFHPRLMEVNLVHGRRVYTKSGRLPPDLVREGYSRGDESSDDDNSSSEDEKSGRNPLTGDGSSGREQRRAERQARKAARRARREEKRAMKRERRDNNRRYEQEARNDPWKLVITFRPAAA